MKRRPVAPLDDPRRDTLGEQLRCERETDGSRAHNQHLTSRFCGLERFHRLALLPAVGCDATTVATGRRIAIGRNVQIRRRAGVGISVYARPSGQVVLQRVSRGRGARGDTQLVEDVAYVPSDRLLADEELPGDRAIRLTSRQQGQELRLSACQTCGQVPPRRNEEADSPPHGRLGAQGRKRLACPLDLQPGGILVTELAAGAPDQDPGLRSLVGGVQSLPGAAARRSAASASSAWPVASSVAPSAWAANA